MKKHLLYRLVAALLPLGVLLLFLFLGPLRQTEEAGAERAAEEGEVSTSPASDRDAADRYPSKTFPPRRSRKDARGAPKPYRPMRTAGPAQRTGANPFLTPPAEGDPLEIALDYLRSSEAASEFTEADFRNPKVSSRYVSKHNGVSHIYLRQTHEGIGVYNGVLNVNVMPDGRIISLQNGFVPDLASKVNRMEPVISAEDAVREAAGHYGLAAAEPLEALPVDDPEEAGGEKLFRGEGISLDPIPAKLNYLALEDDGVRLSWNTVIRFPDGERWLDLNVDAVTGEVLSEANWISDADYNVYASPLEAPNEGGRSIESDPHDPSASPFGWHDTNAAAGAEFTDTRGNNVNAQEDADSDDTGGSRPDGGAALDFDFAVDPSQEPANYQDAVITNLFYWNNFIHDIFWHYGFDEAAGNFQENNYGNGGSSGDPVEADAQDGSGTNNANFGTPPDGSNPRMQMFIWTQTTPNRDSSFDNGIIIHEYGHGISNRLTGGPSDASALSSNQSRGMGEGWSDWLALALTHEPDDTATTARGIGTYVLGEPTTGAGIRPYRYTTDMEVNPQTFGDLNQGSLTVPHGIGSVWCTALWEAYWALIEAHGYDSDIHSGTGGNNIAIQLIIDGMKMQPANPTYMEARDAILAADEVNNGGANQDLLWEAFAKRGMGFSAYDGGDPDSLDVIEAFDLPDDLRIQPGVEDPFHPSGAPGGPFSPSGRTYTLENAGSGSLNWSVSTDADWLAVSPASGTLAASATTTVDVTLNSNADAKAIGLHSATISFTNDGSGQTIPRVATLSVHELGNALDEPGLDFSTGGDAPWFRQTATTLDGVDAAQSGDIDDSQTSWMETRVTGPDTITFFWKVDSEDGWDFLRFLDDGVEQESISGDMDWTAVSYSIPSGTHTLRWEYEKDIVISSGADAGWVDEVRLGSLHPEPTITSHLSVFSLVDQPFSYQIEATNEPTSYSSGTLPAGLSLDTATGLISGTPTVAGHFFVDITATNDHGSHTKTLAIHISDLGDAVDEPGLSLSTGGDAPWFEQTSVTHDGVDAAQSGDVGDDQSSWMEITVTGPDTLEFYWKVDSEDGFDFLRFLDDGVEQESISGDVDWTAVSYSIPSGTRTLRWEYAKDELVSSGADAGWVDELRLASLHDEPLITSELSVTGLVDQPFSYQIEATKEPTSYSSGTLPSGLSLDTSTGLISGTPTVTGTFSVDITATNDAGSDTETLELQLVEVASYPFTEDFESGALQSVWAATGTGEARTIVTQDDSPRAGSWHLTMDSSVDETFSRNELTLAIDLAGLSDVGLTFWAKDFADEIHGPPAAPFSGGADFDGVAVSEDGVDWYEVQPLRSEISGTYSKFVVDLDSAIATHGLSYNSGFRIRFNHYDNYSIPTDGFAFDDIEVALGQPEISVQQPAGIELTDGADVADFGTVPLGSLSRRTFTIRNVGAADLTELSVNLLDGADASDFLVAALDATSLAAGETTTFDVTFSPGDEGARRAAIHVGSNDSDENPFEVALAGEGISSVGEISGVVWADRDGNGTNDGETGHAEITVYLDLDESGDRNGDEPTRVSGQDGAFLFEDLAPGLYTVATEPPANVVQTSPGTEGGSLAPAPGFRELARQLEELETTNSPAPLFIHGEPIEVPPGFRSNATEMSDVINLDLFRADPRFDGIDGSGWSVVIIDTGIDVDHPAFGPDDDGDGISDRIIYQADFADGDTDATDVHDHGSNVASLAASSHTEYQGVAPGANVIPLKVFPDEGDGTFGIVESALQWVANNAGDYRVASVNMSLGDGNNHSSAETLYGIDDEMAVIASLNVAVVSSSGNDFFEADSAQGVGYPSADASSMSVGASFDADVGSISWSGGAVANTSDVDRLAPFSQRHDTLTTAFAPGALSTGANRNGGTVTFTGTSQSSPVIAGVCVLAQQLAGQKLGRRLTQTELVDLIRSNATTINDGDDEDDNVTNTGLNFPRVDMMALGEAILAMARDPLPNTWLATVEADKTTGSADFGMLIGPEITVEQPAGNELEDGTASVWFGVINVGDSEHRTFTIRNEGNEALTGLDASIDGADASAFTAGLFEQTSIDPGESTMVTVSFTPGGAGQYDAALHIASNDYDESSFDVGLSGTGGNADIVVEQPAGTNLDDGANAVDFGPVEPESSSARIFTIRNNGTAPLKTLEAGITGSEAGDYVASDPGAASLQPGESTTLTVTFSPTGPGTRLATLHIGSNDVDENPFDVGLTGLALDPEIVVEQPAGTALTDGGDTVDYGEVNYDVSSDRTFTVRNTGTGTLTDLAATIDGAQAGDFTAGSLGATTLAPEESTTFTVTFEPGDDGARNATLHIASSDRDENPFDVALSGTGVEPEISVRLDGAELSDGGGVAEFEDVVGSSGGSTPRTFTVRNVGQGPLTGLGASIDGDGASDFAAGALPGELAPGESADLTVTFSPSAAGDGQAALHIASNDADENPFDVELKGTRVERTTLRGWAESFGLSGDQLLPRADDDGDLITLLEEYAYGLNPTVSDRSVLVPGTGTAGLPSIRLVGSGSERRLRIEFVRRRTDPDLTYVPEFGAEPVVGSAGGLEPATEPETVAEIDLRFRRVIVEDLATVGTSSARFGRVRLEYPDENP